MPPRSAPLSQTDAAFLQSANSDGLVLADRNHIPVYQVALCQVFEVVERHQSLALGVQQRDPALIG